MLGTITFEDIYGKTAQMQISGCNDIAAISGVAQNLYMSFTEAAPRVVSVSELCPEYLAGSEPTVEDNFDSCEMKAQLDFENRSETELARRHFSMNLPAPKKAVFSGEDDKGLRVNDGVGFTFATNITAFSGKQIRFKRGHCKVLKTSKSI